MTRAATKKIWEELIKLRIVLISLMFIYKNLIKINDIYFNLFKINDIYKKYSENQGN